MEPLALLGRYGRRFMQRMSHDNGASALLQEQFVGPYPVLFPEQWAFIQENGAGPYAPWKEGLPRGPEQGALVLCIGRLAEGEFGAIRYLSREDHAKPTETEQERRQVRFFLVERMQDLTERPELVSAVPQGQLLSRADLPEGLR